jgi:hypothetical protein
MGGVVFETDNDVDQEFKLGCDLQITISTVIVALIVLVELGYLVLNIGMI